MRDMPAAAAGSAIHGGNISERYQAQPNVAIPMTRRLGMRDMPAASSGNAIHGGNISERYQAQPNIAIPMTRRLGMRDMPAVTDGLRPLKTGAYRNAVWTARAESSLTQ